MRPFEFVDDAQELLRQVAAHRVGEIRRHRTVVRLGYAARDAAHGVAVSTERNRLADRVLYALGLEEGDDRFGHRRLAGNLEAIAWADLLEGAVEVVAEAARDLLADA